VGLVVGIRPDLDLELAALFFDPARHGFWRSSAPFYLRLRDLTSWLLALVAMPVGGTKSSDGEGIIYANNLINMYNLCLFCADYRVPKNPHARSPPKGMRHRLRSWEGHRKCFAWASAYCPS